MRSRQKKGTVHIVRRLVDLRPWQGQIFMQTVRRIIRLQAQKGTVQVQGVRRRVDLQPWAGQIAMQGVRGRVDLHPRQAKDAMQALQRHIIGVPLESGTYFHTFTNISIADADKSFAEIMDEFSGHFPRISVR